MATDVDALHDELAVAALERWLVREAVQRDLDASLKSVERISSDMQSTRTVVGCLYKLLCTFPLFTKQDDVGNALREVFCALPSIDASLKARGSQGLKAYLAPILTSQILSGARARRQNAVNLPVSGSVDLAARALAEISEEPSGIANFVEELKRAHCIEEQRTSVHTWASKVVEEISGFLVALASDSQAAVKLEKALNRIPKSALMLLLKSHMTTTASSITLRLSSVRLNGTTMIQRIVADALNYSTTKEEAQLLRDTFSPQLTQWLDDFTRQEYAAWLERILIRSADENGNQLTDRDIVESSRRCVHDYVLLMSNGEVTLDEQTSWRALRYVEVTRRNDSAEEAINVLGDTVLTEALSKLLITIQSQLALSIFSKGSQMTKFAEEVFSCFEYGLASCKNTAMDAEQRQFNIQKSTRRVLDRLVSVAHNVLVADRHSLMHQTLAWVFHCYHEISRLQLPTDKLLDSLTNDSDRVQIMAEAHRVLVREQQYLGFGHAKGPRPKLPVTEGLFLDTMGKIILSELDGLAQDLGESTLMIPRPIAKPRETNLAHAIVDIEVIPAHAVSACSVELVARGFLLCGATRSASIWARRYTDVPEGLGVELNPIVDVCFSNSDVTIDKITESGWRVVPRNLNKGILGRSSMFLWYRRARSVTEASAFAVTGLKVLGSDVDDRQRAAHETCEYRIITSVDNGLFGSDEVWIQGGIRPAT